MKKLYMLGVVILMSSVAGCSLKSIGVSNDTQEPTGEALTGTILTGETSPAMEEFTGAVDSGTVSVVTGSAEVATEQSGVTADFQKLIDERNAEPKDETKLNEADIGLFEKIIKAAQDIGKK
ncbi:MAG: hypothetical protein NTY80_02615 [candidate division SR1 bacterium]|nr:hypothetical protein [candidate division SR1 bacterium]